MSDLKFGTTYALTEPDAFLVVPPLGNTEDGQMTKNHPTQVHYPAGHLLDLSRGGQLVPPVCALLMLGSRRPRRWPWMYHRSPTTTQRS